MTKTTLLCRLFGHKFFKARGGWIYRSPDCTLCFRCGPLGRRSAS